MPVVSACILSALCISTYAAAKQSGKSKASPVLSATSSAATSSAAAAGPASKAGAASGAASKASKAEKESKPSASYERLSFSQCLSLAQRAECWYASRTALVSLSISL